MRPFLQVGILLSVVLVWTVGISGAQEGLTKRDRQGPVTVTVTLAAPPAQGTPVKVKVGLDTHSVALDGIKFEEAAAMRNPDGSDLAPTGVEANGSGHHHEAVLTFPPLAQAGGVRVVVKNVGGVAERSFSWELSPAR